MPRLARRPWVPTEDHVQCIAAAAAALPPAQVAPRIEELVAENHRLHDTEAFNLNPATNVMNPRAERLLAAGLGARTSLGYPGAKYEMGLGAIEQIEVIAAELAARVFDADFAEVRVPSGALANLFVFTAVCQPGDTIVAPPASIGGHVTHHADGAAGLHGLRTVAAPVDVADYTVDVDALRAVVRDVRPRLVTIGGSLNLRAHPVADVRAIADEVGATVMFDAAHLSGLIAGGAWQNPLDLGAHVMTMSTYKSLGGPVGGLVVTRDAALAERLDAVAYPGFTANFDAGRVAALAVTLADWVEYGRAYAAQMVSTAAALADALVGQGVPVHGVSDALTHSHQVAVRAAAYGGGTAMARRLEPAGLLASGIGLPVESVPGDLNGLRLGTPEIVRLGLTSADMHRLAELFARALREPDAAADVRSEIAAWRRALGPLRFVSG